MLEAFLMAYGVAVDQMEGVLRLMCVPCLTLTLMWLFSEAGEILFLFLSADLMCEAVLLVSCGLQLKAVFRVHV